MLAAATGPPVPDSHKGSAPGVAAEFLHHLSLDLTHGALGSGRHGSALSAACPVLCWTAHDFPRDSWQSCANGIESAAPKQTLLHQKSVATGDFLKALPWRCRMGTADGRVLLALKKKGQRRRALGTGAGRWAVRVKGTPGKTGG